MNGLKFNPLSVSVIALDPGETTGFSFMEVGIEVFTERAPVHENVLQRHVEEIDCIKGNPEDDAPLIAGLASREAEAAGVTVMMMLINRRKHAAIVVEDFILEKHAKTRDLLSPVRITARLDQELWRERRRMFLQDRANAKATINDDRLKEFDLYQRKGALRHARDADRHALYFLRRCQNDAALRAAAWPHIFDGPTPKKKRPPKAPGARIGLQ